MKKTLALLAILTATSLSSLANETIWANGIDPFDTSTYYFFTKSGGKDRDMCGVISASCTLAWWQDQMEKSGALIMPKNQPRGRELWDTVLSYWKGKAQPAPVLQFWLSGDTPSYSNDDQWFTEEGKAFKATGGYFPRIAGTHSDFSTDLNLPSDCMVVSVDCRAWVVEHSYEASSQRTAKLFREGFGGSLSTGTHAMAIYGVEVDDKDNIVKVYYDDNNYSYDDPTDGVGPRYAEVFPNQNRRKEGETVDRYTMGATVNNSYGNEISSFALIRTKGIQFTDYDVRVGKNFGSTDETLFSHYCNLLVDGKDDYELKYDLRDASANDSPVTPIQTIYEEDGKTVKERKQVTTGNLRLMDGTVSLVDATGTTAEFDKGGSVEGIVSFESSVKSGINAARKLSVQRNNASVGELAVKTNEGTNTLEVAKDKKLTIGKLSGEGNLNKTGAGAAEVTDAVTLNGEIRVKEGDFIFGQNVVLTDKTVLTVSNGANVQGKEGQALSLSITSGVQVNDGVLTLTTTITGGTLKGSGSFANVTVDGGTLIVGNSPGLQTYTGNLDVNAGDIVFSVSDWGAAATDQLKGWSNDAYSNLKLNGTNELTFGDAANLKFAVGGEALATLLGGTGAFSMDIATGLGNGEEYFNSELLKQLALATTFYVADEEGAFTNGAGLDAGADLTSRIYNLTYNLKDGGVLSLSGSFEQQVVPEPTTGTLSLLALASLAARRRRK